MKWWATKPKKLRPALKYTHTGNVGMEPTSVDVAVLDKTDLRLWEAMEQYELGE